MNEKTFKNKETGQLLKLIETDNPNWKYKAGAGSEQQTLFVELSFKYKDFEKGLKKDWEEIKND